MTEKLLHDAHPDIAHQKSMNLNGLLQRTQIWLVTELRLHSRRIADVSWSTNLVSKKTHKPTATDFMAKQMDY